MSFRFLTRMCRALICCLPFAAQFALSPPIQAAVHPFAIHTQAKTTLINQDFTHSATLANAWAYGGGTCLTAGYSATPATSIPACGSLAPFDKGGSGTLDLTQPVNNTQGNVVWATPLSTSAGLVMTFDYYSYGSTSVPGDGLALILADASVPETNLGGCCGSLDYAPASGSPAQPGLNDAYLAVGLDENGYWTCACEGKTGGSPNPVANIVTVRGSYLTNWTYLLSSSIAGKPAQLPFALTAGKSTTRPRPLTVSVTLTPAGVLSMTIDQNTGHGPVTYIPPTKIVGLFGQPAVPANVYLGFAATQGSSNTRHEISEVTVTTAY